jgi:cation diffusion facilitator CzcD-associated flavoprotein CzcO
MVREKIACVGEDGVQTVDGVLHGLDVLVLTTGFKADAFMRPMNGVGRDGLDLDALWTRRPSAYLAVSVPGFPNLFLLNGPSAPFGNFSAIDTAERQMEYVLHLLDLIRSGGAREVSVAPQAMARYDAAIRAAAKATIWPAGCTSWYLDADGVPTIWPWT